MITAPLLPNVDERPTNGRPAGSPAPRLEVTSPERGIERTGMRLADERNLARIIRAITRDYARIPCWRLRGFMHSRVLESLGRSPAMMMVAQRGEMRRDAPCTGRSRVYDDDAGALLGFTSGVNV